MILKYISLRLISIKRHEKPVLLLEMTLLPKNETTPNLFLLADTAFSYCKKMFTMFFLRLMLPTIPPIRYNRFSIPIFWKDSNMLPLRYNNPFPNWSIVFTSAFRGIYSIQIQLILAVKIACLLLSMFHLTSSLE